MKRWSPGFIGPETMGIKFGLSNISEILHMLGDPQEKFRSVHIAGTKGKGSVSAMAASILRQSGYRTALYTLLRILSTSGKECR